jgi:hypothetical protein
MMWIASFSSRDAKSGTEASTQRESLHVTRAAAVELAISELEFEWIVRPSLALDRNAVAVAGEADAAAAGCLMLANRLAFAPSAEGISVEATP